MDLIVGGFILLILLYLIYRVDRPYKYRYDVSTALIWRDKEGKVHIQETRSPDWDF